MSKGFQHAKGKAPARSRVKDLYATMKKHQAQLEFMDITEEYLKDEMRNLKRNCRQRLSLTQDECTDFMVGEFKELLEIIKQVFRRTQEEEGAAARATTSEQ